MSRVRKIRAKKIKPMAKKFIDVNAGSDMAGKYNRLCIKNSQSAEAEAFKKFKQMYQKEQTKQTIIVAGVGAVEVDVKIDENTGVVITDGKPQIVTTDVDAAFASKEMKKVASLYLFIQAKESLIKQGFTVTETKREDKLFLIGEKTEDEQNRVIEVCYSGDGSIDIESKKFDDAESCKKAVEKVTADLDSDIAEIDPDLDNCTYDFQKRDDKKRKSKTVQTVNRKNDENKKRHTYKNR
ncbi:MAG: hypothetical protein JW925_14370 [Syntrophaceae bacterium]|nr:hypothetical protein [Syntrophaceae bacterium]